VLNDPVNWIDPEGLIRADVLREMEIRNPRDLRRADVLRDRQCGAPPKKTGPTCPPKPPLLVATQLAAAAAVIETGAEIARGGVLLIAAGGPAGVVVGVPVTFLGLGIVAIGVDLIPGVDLGILPKCL
jgi:hypothetical protein